MPPAVEAMVVAFLLTCVRANLPQPVSEAGQVAVFFAETICAEAMGKTIFKASWEWQQQFYKRHKDILRRKAAHVVPTTRFGLL